MLACMAVGRKDRLVVKPASPGAAIAARRRYLGLSQEDVVRLTNGAINLKLLSQLENDHKHPKTMRLAKYQALLSALRWTPAEFEEATGVPPLTSDPLPGAEDFEPVLRIPVMGTVSAGLAAFEEIVEADSFVQVDPRLAPGLASIPPDALVALTVNGDSMISDSAARMVPHGAHVVVEVGAIPTHGDLVVAWLPNRETLVIKLYQEGRDVVLKSYNPRGPVFRLGEEPIEVRGVVRMVQIVL